MKILYLILFFYISDAHSEDTSILLNNSSAVVEKVNELNNCFAQSKEIKNTAKCALKYDVFNRDDSSDMDKFFKNKYEFYCSKYIKENCSYKKGEKIKSFIEKYYSKFYTSPQKIYYDESSRNFKVGDKDCSVSKIKWHYAYSIYCDFRPYVVFYNSSSLEITKAKIVAFSYTSLLTKENHIKVKELWLQEDKEYILSKLNNPVKCFINSKTLEEILVCVNKYGLFSVHMDEKLTKKNVGSILFSDIKRYCESIDYNIDKCLKNEKILFVVISKIYNPYYKEIKESSECYMVKEDDIWDKISLINYCDEDKDPCTEKLYTSSELSNSFFKDKVMVYSIGEGSHKYSKEEYLNCIKK